MDNAVALHRVEAPDQTRFPSPVTHPTVAKGRVAVSDRESEGVSMAPLQLPGWLEDIGPAKNMWVLCPPYLFEFQRENPG